MPDQFSKQLLLNFPTRPEFNFSNFVISQGSRFAIDSAQNFCAPNQTPYHSLFIFGQENIGKTHLLISIGNLVAERGGRAIYIKGSDFSEKVNEGREKVGHNPRRIGETPNPAGLKFTPKNPFD